MSSMKNHSTSKPGVQDLVITRIFDAPKELVWKAWTEPARFMKWWGPKGFTSSTCQIDLRVGGRYLFNMKAPNGREMWTTGTYVEIVPYEKLVFLDHMADEKGNELSPEKMGLPPGWPSEIRTTVTFEDIGGKTRMTVIQHGMPVGDMTAGAARGWNEAFDKMAETFSP